ncbi:RNA-directed DNA polymerase, eukaryota, reverse transcriptase zinc-binding domain protein [Tanacetum coccineum]
MGCPLADRVPLLDWLTWSIDVSVGFSVASVRALVDAQALDMDLVATRWNRCILIKVNVFLWRLKLNKLPSRVNQDRKSIDIGSILCPTYHDDVKMVNHTFFNCEMTKDLWVLLVNWWELDILLCANILEWYDWLNSLHVSNRAHSYLQGVGGRFCGPYGVFVIT